MWSPGKRTNLAGCLGFAIERTEFDQAGAVVESYWMRSIKRFQDKDQGLPPGTPVFIRLLSPFPPVRQDRLRIGVELALLVERRAQSCLPDQARRTEAWPWNDWNYQATLSGCSFKLV